MVYRVTEILLPIARLAKRWHFSPVLSNTMTLGVAIYQKIISPRKGFSCAHRRLYGGVSCSEFFRQSIRTHGVAEAIPRFQARLIDCKQANHQLCQYRLVNLSDSLYAQGLKKKVGKKIAKGCGCGCDVCDCDFCDCDTPDCELPGCDIGGCD